MDMSSLLKTEKLSQYVLLKKDRPSLVCLRLAYV